MYDKNPEEILEAITGVLTGYANKQRPFLVTAFCIERGLIQMDFLKDPLCKNTKCNFCYPFRREINKQLYTMNYERKANEYWNSLVEPLADSQGLVETAFVCGAMAAEEGGSNFKERLENELNRLEDKQRKLVDFLDSERYEAVDDVQKALLNTQVMAMNTYAECLKQRLKRL